VIAYASCQLRKHEQNYPTHNLELAVVVGTCSEDIEALFVGSQISDIHRPQEFEVHFHSE
jgi:hypothetical protein